MAGAFGRARTRGVAPPFNLRFLVMQTFHRDRKRWRPLRYPVMGWSGRAPAPPASEACAGHQRQGARHGRSAQEFDLLRRHRRWQEFVPRRGSRWGGAIVLRQSTTGGYAQRSPTICKENEMGLLIDGGKNSFHVVGLDGAAPSCCGSRRRADTPNARRRFARRMKWDCSSTVVGTISGTIPRPAADVSCVRTVFSATG